MTLLYSDTRQKLQTVAISSFRQSIPLEPKKPIRIVVWYAISLGVIGILALKGVGRETLAEYAKPYKPYAAIVSPIGDHLKKGGNGAWGYSLRIIFLGDSSLTFPPNVFPDSANFQLYIPGFLASRLAGDERGFVEVSEWSYPAANMFDYYCVMCRAERLSPDLVIIPINWSFFGTIFEEQLSTMGSKFVNENAPKRVDQFMRNKNRVVGFAPLSEDFSAGYENPLQLIDISTFEHLRYKAELCTIYPIGFKAFVKRQFGGRIGYEGPWSQGHTAEEENLLDRRISKLDMPGRYPMLVSYSNRHFQLFRSVVDAASRRGINTLFYLSPVNVQMLSEGNAFDGSLFVSSLLLIKHSMEREHIYFLDLHDILGSEDFYDDFGHYTESGKRKIAEALARQVMEIFDKHRVNETLRGTPKWGSSTFPPLAWGAKS